MSSKALSHFANAPTATAMAKKFSAMMRMEILAFQIIKKPQGIHAKFVMVWHLLKSRLNHMPNTKASPAHRLAHRLTSTLSATRVDKEEVTKILIDLLAHQISSYHPIHRIAIWDAAVDELDDMVEVFSNEGDKVYERN